MIAEADKEKIEKDKASVDFARPLIKKQVKALLARDIYGMDYYYMVINQDENVIGEALKVLEEPSGYEQLLVEQVDHD
jgi:carboxyl-terminal processing protease